MKEPEKEPFKFEYTTPTSDWYNNVNVTIGWNDYAYFSLVRRYGPSWWLVGHKLETEFKRQWTVTDVGEMQSVSDIFRFIEWAKYSDRGSKLLEITAISGDFDIVSEFLKLMKEKERIQ